MLPPQAYRRCASRCGLLVLLGALVLLPGGNDLLAQNRDSVRKKRSEPLELPTLIIYGNETLNVKGGRKAAPSILPRLNAADLKNLNSLEKQAPPLLGKTSLPKLSLERSSYTGFVRGALGMFPTADVLAGYSTSLGGYHLNLSGGFTLSDGHTDNADFSRFALNLQSEYVAPEKFWILGGSKTETQVGYSGQAYKLYAIAEAPERTVRRFDLGVGVSGAVDGYAYEAGAGIDHASLAQGGDVTNTAVNGYLGVRGAWSGYQLGGRLFVDLQSLRDDGMQFIELKGEGRHSTETMRLDAVLGAQFGSNSRNESQGGIVAGLQADFRLNEFFTARARLHSGLENTSYGKALHVNPYLADTAEIVFERTLIGGSGQLLYHPGPEFSLGADVSMRMAGDVRLFLADTSGTFYTEHQDASLLELGLEALWQASPRDKILGRLEIAAATLDEGSTDLPGLAPFSVSTGYHRVWTENIYTVVELDHIGERNADKENTIKLAAYTTLGFSASYRAMKNLSISVDIDNLLGSEIYLWQGYKERGIFAELAATWRF